MQPCGGLLLGIEIVTLSKFDEVLATPALNMSHYQKHLPLVNISVYANALPVFVNIWERGREGSIACECTSHSSKLKSLEIVCSLEIIFLGVDLTSE